MIVAHPAHRCSLYAMLLQARSATARNGTFSISGETPSLSSPGAGSGTGPTVQKPAIHRECVQHQALDVLINRKLCVLYAQRAKDILLVQVLHGLPGGPLNDLARTTLSVREYCWLVPGGKVILPSRTE